MTTTTITIPLLVAGASRHRIAIERRAKAARDYLATFANVTDLSTTSTTLRLKIDGAAPPDAALRRLIARLGTEGLTVRTSRR